MGSEPQAQLGGAGPGDAVQAVEDGPGAGIGFNVRE